MTKYHSLTVVLEKDIDTEDSKPIIEAIKMIKGVLSVKGNVSDANSMMAEARAHQKYKMKLIDLLKE